MTKKRLILILKQTAVLTALLAITCTTPQNPFEEDKNALLVLSVSAAPSRGYYTLDTVTVTIKMRLCKFFDTVNVFFGTDWDTSLVIKNQSTLDSIQFRHVLTQTGSVAISATSIMNRGTPRQQNTQITVLGYEPRIIRNLPAATSLTVGTELSLSVQITGTEPIQYTWLRGQTVVSGATSSVYTKTNLTFQDSGEYRCIATNQWGSDTSNPSAVFVFPAGTPNAPVGMRVTSRSGGTVTLGWSSVTGAESYKVYKDTLINTKPSPLAQVFDTSFTAKDTGRFYYWVTAIKNSIESPASSPVFITPIDTTKPRSAPHWVRDTLTISIAEGSTFSINLADSCIDTNASSMLSLSTLNTNPKGRLTANSLYTVSAGNRDSGTYRDTVIALDGLLKDTLALLIQVKATYCTLSVTTVNGQVGKNPAGPVYRWGDSVSLTATPNTGYEFSAWSGNASGSNFAIRLAMIQNKTLTALFLKLPDGVTVPTNGSINQIIVQHKTAASRPVLICPDPGMYDNNTIKINGVVKFSIQ